MGAASSTMTFLVALYDLSSSTITFLVAPYDLSSSTITFLVALYDLSSSTITFLVAPVDFAPSTNAFPLLPLILRAPRIFFAEYAMVFPHLLLARRKNTPVAAKVSFSCPPLIEAHEGGAIAAPPGTVLRQQHTKKGERT
jgi:hypothetical protein